MRKHWWWIIEVLIWLLILISIAGVIITGLYNHRKIFNSYQIFMPDVDGLINGSPVKIMGIQVGYVNQIDIVGEDVYVKFIITDSKVKLPYGAIATVEFSGLGGSKSLELYPPQKNLPNKSKFIVAQSPKRIHDSLGLLNEMFDNIIEITYSVSTFMDKMGVIKHPKCYNEIKPAEFTNDFLNYSDIWLKKANNQTEIFRNKIQNKKEVKNGTSFTQN